MVLSVLNSDPSLRVKERCLLQEKLLASPPKPNRRSRAHNIPGGIKHLLSDPRRRRRVSTRFTSLPSSHRSTRPRRTSPTLATQRTVVPSSCSTPEAPRRRSQSQSRSRTPIPINVTFPQHLPDLPRKQISSEVLASLGFASGVPPQYARDRMECLGPRYEFVLLRSTVSIADVFFIVCIKPCDRPRLHSQGRRYPRPLPSTSMTRLRSHPHIWQPSTHQVPLVLSRSAS